MSGAAARRHAVYAVSGSGYHHLDIVAPNAATATQAIASAASMEKLRSSAQRSAGDNCFDWSLRCMSLDLV